MHYIASISSGLSSAVMYRRLLDRYGKDQVIGVFEDTLMEDEDNYRFLAEIEQWGNPFIRLVEGRTPYQVAEKEQIIPTNRYAPCTRTLKLKPFLKWLQTTYPVAGTRPGYRKRKPSQIFMHSHVILNIGYDFTEYHRIPATQKNYQEKGYTVDFPLLWKPFEERPYVQICREEWGLEPPRMYAMGYRHANCGGMCVKQGKKDWVRTYHQFPERFARIETWEQQMRDHPRRQYFALQTIIEKGIVRPFTLKELRERIEQKQTIPEAHEPGCLVCGIGM